MKAGAHPRRLGRLAVLGAALLVARAGAATPASRAAAEALFDDARALLKAGRPAEACPKLEESQRLDPGVGTLLHLGECYARLGRTASAWAAFRDAESAALAAGQVERGELARARAGELHDRLAHLVIDAEAAAGLAGLDVRRDGERVGRASFGARVPVDPGRHVIEAWADGREPFRASVEVGEGQALSVTIPSLAPLVDHAGATGAASPGPLAPSAPPRSSDARAPWLIGLAGGSAVAVAAGAYLGLSARSAWQRSRSGCDERNACDPSGLEEIDRARSRARWSTVSFGAGLALGGAALALHLTRRRELSVVAHPGGAALVGRFR
ncbi:MAG: hypothetical protein IT374_18395 [Polyangiaceae bacterium]|nr:hypothetical protein [Polyangiaceae bacterium]